MAVNGFCQRVEAATLIGHTAIAPRPYVPMKQPASSPSSPPNSRSVSASLGGRQTPIINAVVAGSLGNGAVGREETLRMPVCIAAQVLGGGA